MYCVSCGSEIEVRERLPFRERCPKCDTALHSCVHCRFYDAGAYNQCRETKAERQVEKRRENRCEYFSPHEGKPPAGAEPGVPVSGKTQAARGAFDALFAKKEETE